MTVLSPTLGWLALKTLGAMAIPLAVALAVVIGALLPLLTLPKEQGLSAVPPFPWFLKFPLSLRRYLRDS